MLEEGVIRTLAEGDEIAAITGSIKLEPCVALPFARVLTATVCRMEEFFGGFIQHGLQRAHLPAIPLFSYSQRPTEHSHTWGDLC